MITLCQEETWGTFVFLQITGIYTKATAYTFNVASFHVTNIFIIQRENTINQTITYFGRMQLCIFSSTSKQVRKCHIVAFIMIKVFCKSHLSLHNICIRTPYDSGYLNKEELKWRGAHMCTLLSLHIRTVKYDSILVYFIYTMDRPCIIWIKLTISAP